MKPKTIRMVLEELCNKSMDANGLAETHKEDIDQTISDIISLLPDEEKLCEFLINLPIYITEESIGCAEISRAILTELKKCMEER